MGSKLAAPSLCMFRLCPPYERLEPVRSLAALHPRDLPPGSLLGIELDHPAENWPRVAEWVPGIRERFPSAPLVLRVTRPPRPEDFEWVRRAGGLRVRAVLFDGDRPRERLERTLTEPIDLPQDVEEWLSHRAPSLPPHVVWLIREIFRLAPRYTVVAELLAELRLAERTARTWCHQAGIPGPGKWLAAAHAVHAALRLQSDHRSSLLTIAVDCGYSDHSSLSRQSLRLFGVRPGAIRRTLGWEWLMERWLEREAPVSLQANSGRSAHRPRETAPLASKR